MQKILVTILLGTLAVGSLHAQNTGINTKSPNSSLTVNGSYAGSYKAIAADATLTNLYQFVNVLGSAATITLPDASMVKGKRYNVKKVDASANGVQVVSAGGTIDGNVAATGVTGTLSWQSWVFQSDGINWYIISKI